MWDQEQAELYPQTIWSLLKYSPRDQQNGRQLRNLAPVVEITRPDSNGDDDSNLSAAQRLKRQNS